MTRLEQIRARIDASTLEPWEVSGTLGGDNEPDSIIVDTPEGQVIALVPGIMNQENAQLIANAPADLALLLEVIRIQATALESVSREPDQGEHISSVDLRDCAREAQAQVQKLMDGGK